MNMDMLQKLAEVSQSCLRTQCPQGHDLSYMPGGINGPYYDLETPLRNTSHWLITSTLLSSMDQYHHFRVDAEKLLNYLLNNQHEKKWVTIHRQKLGKDWCNGVIGQAWVIESLVIAGHLLNRADAIERASQFADVFNFSDIAKAWTKTDPANGKQRLDYTLNHQLWYAAAIAMLDDPSLNSQITMFLDALDNGAMQLREDGVFSHLFYTNTFKGLAFRGKYKLHELKVGNTASTKEIGYHLYNLHPLARLKCHFPEHSVFRSNVLDRALETAFSDRFFISLDDNYYTYPYNSPLFEYPLIANVFGYQLNSVEKIYNNQFTKTYDEDLVSFSKCCPDPATLNARIYEWFIDVYYERYYKKG